MKGYILMEQCGTTTGATSCNSFPDLSGSEIYIILNGINYFIVLELENFWFQCFFWDVDSLESTSTRNQEISHQLKGTFSDTETARHDNATNIVCLLDACCSTKPVKMLVWRKKLCGSDLSTLYRQSFQSHSPLHSLTKSHSDLTWQVRAEWVFVSQWTHF